MSFEIVFDKKLSSILLHNVGPPMNANKHRMMDDLIPYSCRYGGSELHSVASYMGGAAAQEVIKVLTRQFVPINNTYIYNAMKQTSITAQL